MIQTDSGRTARRTQIRFSDFECELPPDARDELKTKPWFPKDPPKRPARPVLEKPKPSNYWRDAIGFLAPIGIILLCFGLWAWSSAHKPPTVLARDRAVFVPSPKPLPSPQPVPRAERIVPEVRRAEPVLGPLTIQGNPMLSGHQYYVTMPEPDGRHLLVNFMGSVDHACNLPRQPKGGANNAAFIETATNHLWIYTVPAGISNVPQWIDP